MNTSLQDAGLLLLRVVPSGIMMTRGWAIPTPPRPMGFRRRREVLRLHGARTRNLVDPDRARRTGGASPFVGLQTRLAAIPAAFTMAWPKCARKRPAWRQRTGVAVPGLLCRGRGFGRWPVERRRPAQERVNAPSASNLCTPFASELQGASQRTRKRCRIFLIPSNLPLP